LVFNCLLVAAYANISVRHSLYFCS
jgi:hypothetical protein